MSVSNTEQRLLSSPTPYACLDTANSSATVTCTELGNDTSYRYYSAPDWKCTSAFCNATSYSLKMYQAKNPSSAAISETSYQMLLYSVNSYGSY